MRLHFSCKEAFFHSRWYVTSWALRGMSKKSKPGKGCTPTTDRPDSYTAFTVATWLRTAGRASFRVLRVSIDWANSWCMWGAWLAVALWTSCWFDWSSCRDWTRRDCMARESLLLCARLACKLLRRESSRRESSREEAAAASSLLLAEACQDIARDSRQYEPTSMGVKVPLPVWLPIGISLSHSPL